MKRYTILALAAVLTMTLFAGCRRKNNVNTVPTTMPPVIPSTQATTAATTAPTTMPTEPSTAPSIPDSSNVTEEAGTGTTEETGATERSRGIMPGNHR